MYVNVVSSDAWDIVTVRIQHHTDLNLGRRDPWGRQLEHSKSYLHVLVGRSGKGLTDRLFIEVTDGHSLGQVLSQSVHTAD